MLDVKDLLAPGVGPPPRPLRKPGTDKDLIPSHLHDLMLASWYEAGLTALRQFGVEYSDVIYRAKMIAQAHL